MGALLHQLVVEIGPDPLVLRRYLASVIGICTDQGVESSLYDAPRIDLVSHIRNEAQALQCEADLMIPDALLPLSVPPDLMEVRNQEDWNPSQEAYASMTLLGRLFPNALFIPGVKHGLDNALHDCWDAMQQKEIFLRHLRSLECIVKQPGYRDKLRHVFFSGSSAMDSFMNHRLKFWKSSLTSLRWHAVVDFVRELKVLKDGLRQRWNLQQFLKTMPAPRDQQQDLTVGEGRGSLGPSTFRCADEAITSSFFWAYCDMLLDVSWAPDLLSRWVETCKYHGTGCTERTCSFKGARAPELAAGCHKYLLQCMQSRSDAHVRSLAHMSESDATSLIADWHAAQGRLALEFDFKFHHWELLPWRLCGLALHDLTLARVIARQSQVQWSNLSANQKRYSHPVTRRFLDAQWSGRNGVKASQVANMLFWSFWSSDHFILCLLLGLLLTVVMSIANVITVSHS